jgi:hypothetical protein
MEQYYMFMNLKTQYLIKMTVLPKIDLNISFLAGFVAHWKSICLVCEALSSITYHQYYKGYKKKKDFM